MNIFRHSTFVLSKAFTFSRNKTNLKPKAVSKVALTHTQTQSFWVPDGRSIASQTLQMCVTSELRGSFKPAWFPAELRPKASDIQHCAHCENQKQQPTNQESSLTWPSGKQSLCLSDSTFRNEILDITSYLGLAQDAICNPSFDDGLTEVIVFNLQSAKCTFICAKNMS